MVELRRLFHGDRKDCFRWRNDPRVSRWCRQAEPLHAIRHKDWYEWQAKDPHTSMFAIEHVGGLVGVCGLTSIDWINRRAEFSLYIDPDQQGRGYGPAALAALITHGFRSLGLNVIWGEVFDGNPALKHFNAIGFKHEGTRREFYFRDGAFIDAHLISITSKEWETWKSLHLPLASSSGSSPDPSSAEAGAITVVLPPKGSCL